MEETKMITESKGIYHWKLGDLAKARMCKKVYVRILLQKEHIVPLEEKPSKAGTLECTTWNTEKAILEDAFKEFVRRGKEQLFDQYFEISKQDKHLVDLLMNFNASTEDKLEMVIRNTVSEKELDNYLKQCWRYDFMENLEEEEYEPTESEMSELLDITNSISIKSPMKPEVTVHISWCLICGKGEDLHPCTDCPASYHVSCRSKWLLTIAHRKKTPDIAGPVMYTQQILSSTRTVRSVQAECDNMEMCSSCNWGPKVGYDDLVWHKLRACSWWPAKVLPPGKVPSCLTAQPHSPHDWPLRYYGTLNHSWGSPSRVCLFLPSHTAALSSNEEALRDAVMDACDDYITVYLT